MNDGGRYDGGPWDEDAKALRELHKKLSNQAAMGTGEAQTFDAAVKGTKLQRIAQAFDALAMVAK